MSREAMPVDEQLSWAHRSGNGIRVSLRLPGADLTPGAVTVRLGRNKEELRLTAEARSDGEASILSFAVDRTDLGRGAWRLSLQTGERGPFVPVSARLLAAAGQPVALLPGPTPATKMRPPTPGRRRRGPAAAAPSRRTSPLRRVVRGVLRRGRRTARAAQPMARPGRQDASGRGGEGRPHPADSQPARPERAIPRVVVRAAARHGMVILAESHADDLAASWRANLGDDVAITPLRVDQETPDVDALERRLCRLGSPGVLLVVLSPDTLDRLAVDHRGLLMRLFPHVRHRGAYAVQAVPTPGATVAADLANIRRTLEEARDEIRGRRSRSSEIPPGARKIVIGPELVALTKRGWHLLNVREELVHDLLPAREPGVDVTVIDTRPAGVLKVQMQELPYGHRQAEPWADRLPYPAMEVRHYRGEFVSLGKMLVAGETTMLPESFRWPHREILNHDSSRDASRRFSQLPHVKDAPVLEGDYYFLDCLFPGHFGHLLTEVLCRLWGWDAARRELPDLKALFHIDQSRGRIGTLERRLFTAYGIPESDIIAADEPVRLRSVVGASPMWHNAEPYYAHPDIQETWSRITAGLLDGDSPADHERIFVSRDDSLNRRRCRNQRDVERFFADRGFHVLYPERIPLEQQAAIFAGARVVAGFGGSAMFNMMHCQRLETTVVISHNAYHARNENLYTSILGGQLHYFWQESDIPVSESKSEKHARRSSYEFDFGRYGAELARVLDEA